MRRLGRTGTMLCGLAIVGAAAGCALRGDTTALEDELRGREDRILALERELSDARDELTVARREAEHLRGQAAATGGMVLTSEQSEVLFRAEGLRINTLLTGGLDDDDRPGDEILNVVLEPFDAHGQTIKLPGAISIDLTDPAAEGTARSLGEWSYSVDEVREAWHAGLLVTGFRFHLPYPTAAQHETLVLHARLTTDDGRVFDATETIDVDVPGAPRPLAATKSQLRLRRLMAAQWPAWSSRARAMASSASGMRPQR